jgi:Ca2+-binding RTX toxin-like protein
MKLEVTVNANIHVHLPPVFTDDRAEEILDGIAIIHRDLTTMTDATDRLSREVAETRQAVTDLTGRYQAKIDQLQTHVDELQVAIDAEDPDAIQAAADALDALQTEMAALGADTASGTETVTDTTGGGAGDDTIDAGTGTDTVSGTDPAPQGTEQA